MNMFYKHEIELLQRISNAYLNKEENDVYAELISLLINEVEGDFGFVGYIEENKEMVCHATSLGKANSGSHDVLWLKEHQWKELWGSVAEKNEIQIEHDLLTEGIEEVSYKVGYYLNAPIFSHETFIGLIQIQSESKIFDHNDVHTMEKIVNYIAPIQYAWYEKKQHIKKEKNYLRNLKNSVTKYNSLFSLSSDMIFLNTADGKILETNKAGARLLGYESPKEIIGTYVQNYYYDPNTETKIQKEMDEKGYVKNLEIVLRRKNGEKKFCIVNAQKVLNTSRSEYIYQSIVHDITERIRQEQIVLKKNLDLSEANRKLQETQRELVQREKMASIGQLSAGIAHEINNPIGFVKSNYYSLKSYLKSISRFLNAYKSKKEISKDREMELQKIYSEENIDYILEDLDDLFEETEEGIQRIMSIVRNLKNFSRAGTDENVEDYNMNDGIKSTLIIAKNEYKYVAEIEEHLGKLPEITCNANRINQVFLNLIVNAAYSIRQKESTKEEGKIVVRTWTDKDNVYCSITDNGEGIPGNIKDKIFEPFYTTKKSGEGTGLGLSISYDIIVNDHGGAIDVESVPAEGTRFTLSLPVTKNKAKQSG
ncbi:MAG: ATP-binding protein [Spirochaetia bacterium]